MVVGNGLIASVFSEYINNDSVIIFASGVSNSKTNNQYEFDREITLLSNIIKKNIDKKLIYFSSCSIENKNLSNDPYHLHKKNIEKLIKLKSKKFVIFRLSNVVGKVLNDKSTIVNYLIQKTLTHECFEMWRGAVRNIIDIDDIFKIVDYIVKKDLFLNSIVNIANPFNYSVENIAHEIKLFFNMEQNFIIKERDETLRIDVNKIRPIIKELDINFNDNYFQYILSKYYKNGEV